MARAGFLNSMKSRYSKIGLCLCLGLSPAVLHAATTIETPPPETNTVSHFLVADLDSLLTNLAAHGVQFSADADRAPLYECIARVADPAARVFAASAYEHWQQEQSGLDYQPGFQLTVSNATPVVAAVPESFAADLRVGDRLLAIQGAATTNVTLSEALSLVRGHSASNLEFVVARGAAAAATTVVERTLSPLPLLETSEKWPRQIGYMRVNGLTSGAGEQVLALLREWGAAKFAGGILDLRGASGNDVQSAAAIASPFASPGSLLFSFRDRDGNTVTNYQAGETAPIDLPLMLLVDEKTAGASEVLTASAVDSLRGVLVIGRTTAGDPGIREGVPVRDDQVLYIATRRLVTGNGRVYDGQSGVSPNVSVAPRAASSDYEPEPGPDRRLRLDEEASDRALRDRIRGDAVLQRAVDVLLGLKALNIRPGTVSSSP